MIIAVFSFTLNANAINADKEKYKKYKAKADKLLKQKRIIEAKSIYQKALKHKPKDKYVLNQIDLCEDKIDGIFNNYKSQGDTYASKGDCNKAMLMYDSAMIYKPNAPSIISVRDNCDAKVGSSFNKVMGNKNLEEAHFITQLRGGGQIVGGRNVSTTNGATNPRIIKLSPAGDIVWDHTYGATDSEEVSGIVEAKNNNLIVVGQFDEFGNGSDINMWVMCMDSNGKEIWVHNYGHENSIDMAKSITETKDGGFLILGTTYPLEGTNAGKSDLILIKIDAEGNKEWEKIIGESSAEEAVKILPSSNGYFLLANKEVKSGIKYQWDAWIVAISEHGKVKWSKTYGGGESDKANDIARTKDGGFVITGFSYSYQKFGGHDAMVIKINKEGLKQWYQVYGGLGDDEGFGIIENSQGDLLLAGYTNVFVQDRATMKNISKDGDNYFLVRITKEGKEIWQRSFGGENKQRLNGIVEAKDGGYVTCGYSFEGNMKNNDISIQKVNRAGKQ